MELPGQLSPELVLVDPELALWARARLAVPAQPRETVAPRVDNSVAVTRHGALERVLLAGIVLFALEIAFGLAHHDWHYAAAVAGRLALP